MRIVKLSRRAAVAAAMASIGAAAVPAVAQDFQPGKPIVIVAPFGPGTTNDIIARLLAQDMTATLGQSVIVENRPGATGNIGVDYTAKARPDGHTVVISSLSNIINQASGNNTVNLLDDLTPVSFTGGVYYSMFVPNELPAKSVAELVELARKQPGKINFSGFAGGVPQFLGEMLNRAAKIDMVMIPYKSTTDALNDLLTNRIQVWFTPVASGVPVHNAKQARLLAVTGEKRATALPDIPTFKELGYPDIVADVSFYMMAPKGTPQPIVDKLYRAADKAMENPKVRESFRVQGIEDRRGGPAELGAYIAGELRRWTEIVKLSAPAK
ncbi:MAG: tripartite tricarboxylate transporter substrate binding protein [Reyranella sp.]|uniref:Bug family tripartite tricarboxylate transporter substrate binding protein n=1 Tax=Reyranella sp. TaxID=1929291 RepID=UPI0011F4E202|nr:tripartite tricarboxylate transporter substrate binding protein [Reyranella sp.]TAJ85747.1 MAG: tripartite tricarboxylate transporter substrate binding protein [Reyranella sp.]TBR27929.1 MAG: tripartite tricarboxylate transporter substrate binding protein [Reyranella sp.]